MATRLIPGGPVIRSLEKTVDGNLSSVNFTTGYDPPGIIISDTAGKKYMFVQATTDAILVGNLCLAAQSDTPYLVTDDTTASFMSTANPIPMGIAIGTISAGRWGWIQRAGYCGTTVKGSVNAAAGAIALGDPLYANCSTQNPGLTPQRILARTAVDSTSDYNHGGHIVGFALAAAASTTTTGPAVMLLLPG